MPDVKVKTGFSDQRIRSFPVLLGELKNVHVNKLKDRSERLK